MNTLRDCFLIGDLQTAAVIGPRACINWLCLPSVEGASVFASLLDPVRGGSFGFDAPDYATSARYLPYSAVVETQFTKDDHTFLVHDFMIPRQTEDISPHTVVRRLVGTSGKGTVRLCYDPRPNYARQRSIIKQEGSTFLLRIEERMLSLHLPKDARVLPRGQKQGLTIEIDLDEGEQKDVILEYAISQKSREQKKDPEAETIDFWKKWITEGMFIFSRKHVVQSAITLKLMQYFPTGGLIAAPTTSLPYKGFTRDHRTVWLREATFTLYAFSVLGFTKEAQRFFQFLDTIAEDAKRCESGTCDLSLSSLYTVYGQPLQGETVLSHLRGLEGTDVHIGHHAAEHFQLDIFGAIIDAFYGMERRGRKISPSDKEIIRMLLRAIELHWQNPDLGFWDQETIPKQYCSSKLMAWVGLDRALRLAKELNASESEQERWRSIAGNIQQWIEKHGTKNETLTTAAEESTRDAANLLSVLLFFESRHSESARTLVAESIAALTVEGPFLKTRSDEVTTEASYFATFLAIAALAATGKQQEAEERMRAVETLMPKSGLMAEGIDPRTGEQKGNFPSALSHIGYIVSAFYIHRYRNE